MYIYSNRSVCVCIIYDRIYIIRHIYFVVIKYLKGTLFDEISIDLNLGFGNDDACSQFASNVLI